MSAERAKGGAAKSLRVESRAFAEGSPIPERHTADGEDLSPPLAWTPGPAGTVSYALVVDDPDAPGGTWVHWTLWNLSTNALEEGASATGRTPAGAVEGRNSWGRIGWGGPQPPSGTHRYYFRVFALDRNLDLGKGADRAALESALRGHQLGSGELMGRYTAKR